MDIQNYLDRINDKDSIGLDFATLKRLHRANMLAVPFENLDIRPLNRPIYLNVRNLWEKIVLHRRGGFCYELNGLFAWLLEQIGFTVNYLNAHVYDSSGELGCDFDHLTLLVQIPGMPERWIADVGFGDSFLEPLSLDEKGRQVQGLRAYRLETNRVGIDLLQSDEHGMWIPQYFFDLLPHKFPDDYEGACLYHQTSPLSSFTRKSVISIAIPEGRITLDDDKLIETKGMQRHETPVSPEERPLLLQRYFGVVL